MCDPMDKMRPPHVPEQPVKVLSELDIKRLLATCNSQSFEDRRDEAIIRLLADTGIRRAELLGLRQDDVHLHEKIVDVLGKGRRPRQAPFGNRTARDLDRYEAMRSQCPSAHLDWFWLSRHGQFKVSGLATMLERRGVRCGLGRLHAHAFRHAFAHHWLSAGGREGDLMRLAGWHTREMLTR